ncbi:DUF6056 family protein [Aeromonas sanarellii]
MNRIGFDKIAFFIAAFLIVLIPSLRVPMQSDDYSYYLMGLSPSAHLEHYMGWSGRVVTNIISTALLSTMPHIAYEVINSIAFALLALFITVVPIGDNENSKFSFYVRASFLFVLYWIANPNLGQTSFWIVGAANYMWTNMFIAVFFVYLIRVINNNRFNPPLLFVLAFLAGCSNENTAIVVVLITVFMVFYERASSRIKGVSIAGTLIGALLLILAPGNSVRASHFEYWNSLDFLQKVQIQFFDRLPQAASEYWQVYLVMIAGILVAAYAGTLRKLTIIYMTVFFVASILANAAFIGSPVLPPRSMNGALCFLLISLSFVLVDVTKAKSVFGYGLISSVGLLCIFYFVPSYYLFNKAMHATFEQAQIREKIILSAKINGQYDVKIPEFYFPQLAKYHDRFDTYHSKALARYYGVTSTEMFRIGFDYSQINKAKYITVNKPFLDGFSLKHIYFYSENMGMKNMALLEFSGPINKKANPGDRIFMHIYRKGYDGFINADVDVYPTMIDGRYFTWRDVGKVKIDQIEKVEVGVYNTKTKIRIVDYTVFNQ